MKIRGADFVAYHVSNLKNAALFYRNVLDLPQTEYKEDWQWAEFDCGNITLTLYGPLENSEHPSRDLSSCMVSLAVDDIHTAYEELTQKGAAIKNPPFELSGCWHLEIFDPDRNVILIHQRKDGTVGQEH